MPGKVSLGSTTSTISQLVDKFASKSGESDLRYSKKKGLYAKRRPGLMSEIRCIFCDRKAIEHRWNTRGNAEVYVKKAIDAEFGPGMGDRAFTAMGQNFNNRILQSGDLLSLRGEAKHIKDEDQKKALDRAKRSNMDAVFSEARQTLKTEIQDWTADRFDFVKNRMVDAIVSLKEGATPEDCKRAAVLVLKAEEYIDKAEKKGASVDKAFSFEMHKEMQQFMPKSGHANAGAEDALIDNAFQRHLQNKALESENRKFEAQKKAAEFTGILREDYPFL